MTKPITQGDFNDILRTIRSLIQSYTNLYDEFKTFKENMTSSTPELKTIDVDTLLISNLTWHSDAGGGSIEGFYEKTSIANFVGPNSKTVGVREFDLDGECFVFVKAGTPTGSIAASKYTTTFSTQYKPSDDISVPIYVTDNSVFVTGRAVLKTTGTIEIYSGVSNNFQNIGNAGFESFSFLFTRNVL